jgi:hypothetical protein
MGVWWRLRGVTECPICCKLMKTRAQLCRHCGFNVLEYNRAECRCWLRDSIRGLSPVQRSQWAAEKPSELRQAARLLEVEYIALLDSIVNKGQVPGLKSNRSTVGPPPSS